MLVSRVPLPPAEAHRHVRELLVRHPGCLAAAVPGSETGRVCVVGVRDGAGGVFSARLGQNESRVPVRPQAVVSVVHAWVAAGGSRRSVGRSPILR